MTSQQALVLGADPTGLLFSERRLIAVDTETFGLEYTDDLLGVSLAWRDGSKLCSCYLQLLECGGRSRQLSLAEVWELERREMSANLLVEALVGQHVLVFHSEAFDYRGLFRRFRAEPPRWAHDVKHLAGLLEHQPRGHKSLLELSERYIPDLIPDWYRQAKEQRGNLWRQPLEYIAKYAKLDAELTYQLYERLAERLKHSPLVTDAMYQLDRRFAWVVMAMIQRGLPLDYAWCEAKERDFTRRLRAIEAELRGKGLRNPGSNPQVAAFLTNRLGAIAFTKHTRTTTPGWEEGIPSVAEEALLPLGEHPEVQLILEHRSLAHALATWIKKYQKLASLDGKVHSQLEPFGAISSRMAASGPNVQGIPMENRGDRYGTMLGLFRDQPGYRLMAVDLKQAEVRLAAILAHENKLAQIFAAGGDPYRTMAQRLWGDPGRRQMAKQATLASIYEVGPAKFSLVNKIDEDEAYRLLVDFRRSFPRMKAASQLLTAQVERQGYVRLHTGRPRWFGPEEEAYKGFNQLVQGGVAEIMKEAMVNLERERPGCLRLQVHDSLVLSVPDGPEGEDLLRRADHWLCTALPERLHQQVSPAIPFITDTKLWQLPEGEAHGK